MIKVVCEFCKESLDVNDASLYLEINFVDKGLYFKCPACKKNNKLELKKDNIPLPKSRVIR